MFRRWLPISLIVGALALVAVGGAALAAGVNDETTDDLLDRAAAGLGLEPDDVKAAHAQAQREIEQEKRTEVLHRMVERGVITQEEADSVNSWLDARPDSADRLLQSRGSFVHEFVPARPLILGDSGVLGVPGHAPWLGSDEVIERMAEILGVEPDDLRQALQNGHDAQQSEQRLDALHAAVDDLLAEEEITEAEAAELHTWVDAMPEWLLESNILGRIGPGLWSILGGGLLPREAPILRFGPEFPETFQFHSPHGFEFRDAPFDDRRHFEFQRIDPWFERFNLDDLEDWLRERGIDDLQFPPEEDEAVPATPTPEAQDGNASTPLGV